MRIIGHKAQSFIEFALVLPVLLIVLMGVIELTFFIGSYINVVDLTREAARFASTHDPFDPNNNPSKSSCLTTDTTFNFYFDTTCIFAPIGDNSTGFNSNVNFKTAEDDILVTVFTITGVNVGGIIQQQVTNQWPSTNGAIAADSVWVWSNHDGDTTHNDNWRRNCNKLTTPQAATPYFTQSRVQSMLINATNQGSGLTPTPGSTPNKGFVVVETFFCYHQVLGAPLIAQFVANPILIHTYTIMPLPASAPTPTPKPTSTP